MTEQLGRFVLTAENGGFRVCCGGREVLRAGADFFAGLRTELAPRTPMGNVFLHRTCAGEAVSAGCALHRDGGTAVLSGTLNDAAHTPWTFSLAERGGGLAFAAELAPDSGFTELRLRFAAGAQEGFYGFGEQYSHWDMSGQRFCLCTSEQGIGRGRQPLSFLVDKAVPGAAGTPFTTYAPMPLFLTSENRALLFFCNTIYHFDIKRARPDCFSAEIRGLRAEGLLLAADSPAALIELHTAVTGRLRPLPDFSYDTILGVRGGRETAERILAECLRRGTPVHALWIEDWEGRRGKNGGPPLWWRWYPDETLYPDFRAWADDLRRRGIALLGYANPNLSADAANPLFAEAQAKGYLVKRADGTDYIAPFITGAEYSYACVDLTNPAAYAWLKEKMRAGMLENGLSGWMADYGEYLPLEGAVCTGSAVEAHCELPRLWAQLNSELIDENGGRGKMLVFHRSAGMGSNAYAAAYWAGDQNPTFDADDGLLSSITGILSGGLCGMAVNHTDIGGFTTIVTPVFRMVRKKEVFLRWLEYAAFTPVYRTHDGAYSNKDNYQFYYDEDGYAAFARLGRLHSALKWYFLQLQQEACEKGLPMMRPLWLHDPDSAESRAVHTQYLLGADLLVSPAAKLHTAHVSAWLPAGEWISPWDGTHYTGRRRVRLPAPLGRPPVLVRAGVPDTQRLLDTLRGALEP